MNIVVFGDGERDIFSEDIITSLSKIASQAKDSIMINIDAHGNTLDEKHHYLGLGKTENIFTTSFLNTISGLFLNQPLEILLNSCDSGVIIFDYTIKLPVGSKIFATSSAVSTSSSGSTKLMLQNFGSNAE